MGTPERHHPLEPRSTRWIGHLADEAYREPWTLGVNGTILATGALLAVLVEIGARATAALTKRVVIDPLVKRH